MRAFLLLTLTGCIAMIQSGKPYRTDHHCGDIRGVQVVLRAGVESWPAILTCDEAVVAVAHAMGRIRLKAHWTVYFTMGAPGLDVGGDMNSYIPAAVTYNEDHAIECKAVATRFLAGEFKKVAEIEKR